MDGSMVLGTLSSVWSGWFRNGASCADVVHLAVTSRHGSARGSGGGLTSQVHTTENNSKESALLNSFNVQNISTTRSAEDDSAFWTRLMGPVAEPQEEQELLYAALNPRREMHSGSEAQSWVYSVSFS